MHQKFFVVAIIISIHLPEILRAQTPCDAQFSGQVRDEADRPLPASAVFILPPNTVRISDGAGNFSFTGICPGTYRIRVQSLGYHDLEFDVQITGSIHRVIHLKEDVRQLGEVLIQHHDERHTEHATNVTQLNERELSTVAGKTLGEALRKVTGVTTLQSGPAIFKPVIHGVHSQRILILNHGIRQEGQQWGAEHAPEIDPFIASNIVVIKDAAAIKYGTDALGGVIIVNPPALPEAPGLAGTATMVAQTNGRSGTFSGMLEGGAPKLEQWGWRVQGTVKRTGDFSAAEYNLVNTGVRELNFSGATGYHGDKSGFDVFFSHFETTLGIFKGTAISNLDDLVAAMERDVPLYSRAFAYSIAEPRQKVSHNLLKINGHLETSGGEWRLQYGFQNNNRREFDIRTGGLSHIPAIDLRLNTHSIDAEWETRHSERRTFTAGASAIYQENTNIPGTRRVPFIPNFTNVSGGLFALSKFYVSRWTLDAGLRYDYRHYDVMGYDYKNSYYQNSYGLGNISASAGAAVRLKKNHRLTLNVSSAWRPPHVAELFSVGTHQSAAAIEYGLLLDPSTNEVLDMSAVDFKTEKALKAVATFEGTWQNLTLEVSPFANLIYNYIYLKPGGITTNVRGVYPYFRQSQTDALFVGADVAAHWHVGPHFSIVPRASLLRASDQRRDDFLVFIPANRYEAIFRYEKNAVGALRNFYVESAVPFVQKQHRAPRVVTARQIKEAAENGEDPFYGDDSNFDFMEAPDGYWLLNVAAGVSVKRQKVQYDVRISSENTLDTRYREYNNRLRYYADDMGRNIIFSLKCIF